MKYCYKCKTTKPLINFYKDRTTIDGLQNMCKECSKIYKKEHYKLNKKKYCDCRDEFRTKNPKRQFIISTLNSHRIKGIKINISIDELYEHILNINECEYCGKKLNFECMSEWLLSTT